MPEKRLEKCRDSYQITNCSVCGKPTCNFNIGNVCGSCMYAKERKDEPPQIDEGR